MARRRTGPTLIQQSRRVSSNDKAWYAETGTRPFLKLTDAELRAISDRLDRGIRQRAGRST